MPVILTIQTLCFAFLMFTTGHILNAQAGDQAALETLNSMDFAYAVTVCCALQLGVIAALFIRAFRTR